MIPSDLLTTLEPALVRTVDADVVVVGGGTAGFLAAVASARTGAHTILVEYLPFLGGGHSGGGCIVGGTGFYHTYLGERREQFREGKELLVRGLPYEYMNRLIAAGAAHGDLDNPPEFIANDVELTEVVAEQMVEEAGTDTWLMTQFVDAVMNDGRLEGLLVSRGSGLCLIRTQVAVDASGDGELAHRGGASHEFGRATDHVPQPSTMFFDIAGVDLRKLLDHLKANPDHLMSDLWTRKRMDPSTTARHLARAEEALDSGGRVFLRVNCGYEEAVAKGEIPVPPGGDRPVTVLGGVSNSVWRSGRWMQDITTHNIDMAFGLDATDRDQLDDALVQVRRFILKIVDYYRKYVPGYENAVLLRFAPLLGVRESRRIVGDYTITEQDVLRGARFKDAIGRCGAYIDVHGEEVGMPVDFREVGGERGWFHIPYRALLPRGVDGVLLAGRLISSDHIAQGSIRNQVPCWTTGHAAGTAAALAARAGVSPRELGAEIVQATLGEQGAII